MAVRILSLCQFAHRFKAATWPPQLRYVIARRAEQATSLNHFARDKGVLWDGSVRGPGTPRWRGAAVPAFV